LYSKPDVLTPSRLGGALVRSIPGLLNRYSHIAANPLLHRALANEASTEGLPIPEGHLAYLLMYLI
jgi:hypothetical protein